MSKRFSNESNAESPAKRFKGASSKDRKSLNNAVPINQQNNYVWGDDFGEEEIEEMDYIASQATQEVLNFMLYYKVNHYLLI